jgi:uncharacterized protein
MSRRRVVVVGSGVAGLTAAYLLQRSYDVTLLEADDRLGGHAHTHEISNPDGRTTNVDSGFIVHNQRTYPNLLRLFAELAVPTQASEMSMSVRCEGCGLEYAGARGLAGLFAQPRNLANGRYLRMLAEVRRFHRHARRVLEDPDAGDVTLGAFCAVGGYSKYFVEHFLLPVVSAVWSTGGALSKNYPARYLFAFLRHHGALAVSGSPTWRTVVGGSQTYVQRAAKSLTATLVSTPVRTVTRTAGGVEVRDDADAVYRADYAVLATHPDQALGLLAAPTAPEREILGAFRYSRNETVLHTDSSVLPAAPAARASWNYLKPACTSTAGPVIVNYDLTRLMRLPEPTRYLVTLNAADRIRQGAILARMVYEHPVYTPESLTAQRRLPELGTGVVRYAGAYHGWGFHEDGCAAGVAVAESLGAGWASR